MMTMKQDPAPDSNPAPNRPGWGEFIWEFTKLGITGFGGWLQARLFQLAVERKRWLSKEEFSELVVTASLAPGGNSSNLGAELGRHLLGYRGMLVGYLSLLIPGTLLMVMVGGLYTRYQNSPGVVGILNGMESAAVGMILFAAVKLLPSKLRWFEPVVAVGACLALVYRLPVEPVIFVSGLLVYGLSRPNAKASA
jgi:chromate transporter